MKPLVSILIPAYNAQEWIAETLKSAVEQTWQRREIIVVDDGSVDHTLEIARRFASPTVSVVTQHNQGAASARNAALSLSQGDYIQWLDADDLLSPDKIERQIDVSQQCHTRRTLLSSMWGRFMYRRRRATFVPTDLWCDLSPVEWLLRKMANNLHMQTSTWLVSRELMEAAGPWDTSLLGDDDGEYFCRVLLQSDGIRFVPEAKVFYRMAGSNSLSYIGLSDKKMDAQFRSMLLHISYLRSMEESERVRAACVKYLRNWQPNFYPDRPDIVARAEKVALELGGRLETPKLSWKYAWVERFFGRSLAKRVQIVLPQVRWSMARRIDKALFGLESRAI
jgi:glycosyltransferase involved in cell wall biosynthesis